MYNAYFKSESYWLELRWNFCKHLYVIANICRYKPNLNSHFWKRNKLISLNIQSVNVIHFKCTCKKLLHNISYVHCVYDIFPISSTLLIIIDLVWYFPIFFAVHVRYKKKYNRVKFHQFRVHCFRCRHVKNSYSHYKGASDIFQTRA